MEEQAMTSQELLPQELLPQELLPQELLPAGVYPIWSPYDSQEATQALLNALTEDQPRQP